MADKNIQMTQRNSANTAWDNIYPITKATNVNTADGGNVEAKLAAVTKVKTGITILATGWVDDTATSGFYIYDISNSDILATTVVDVNIRVADLDKASGLKSACESFAGKVRLYASEKPTENIICDLKLVRQVI